MLKKAKKQKYISPLSLFFLNLLPSILLLVLIVIGLISVAFSTGQTKVLGVQTVQPQIKTETIENRVKELVETKGQIQSEAVNNELSKLR